MVKEYTWFSFSESIPIMYKTYKGPPSNKIQVSQQNLYVIIYIGCIYIHTVGTYSFYLGVSYMIGIMKKI